MVSMGARGANRYRHRRCGTSGIGALTVLLAGLLLGCDSRPGSGASSEPTAAEGVNGSAGVAPSQSTAGGGPARPRRLPVYDISDGLRQAYPDVVVFLNEFLNTCLVGDYAGYRRLVSRAATPESRERFEAIYQATVAVTVESIEPVELPQVSPPAYRVVSRVEFNELHQERFGEVERQVAILVFREGEQWRMAPAPRELQPQKQPPPSTSPAAPGPALTYPWDQRGDY